MCPRTCGVDGVSIVDQGRENKFSVDVLTTHVRAPALAQPIHQVELLIFPRRHIKLRVRGLDPRSISPKDFFERLSE